MATPSKRSMATPASKRLFRELKMIQRDPVPGILARPNPANILEWHYSTLSMYVHLCLPQRAVITGPQDSAYAGGEYHGKIKVHPSGFVLD